MVFLGSFEMLTHFRVFWAVFTQFESILAVTWWRNQQGSLSLGWSCTIGEIQWEIPIWIDRMIPADGFKLGKVRRRQAWNSSPETPFITRKRKTPRQKSPGMDAEG